MNESITVPWSDERLLTFEVGDALYALPIAGVLEVVENQHVSCIPTLPADVGGVTNYHGDALPVLRRSALLEVEEHELPEPQHVLVLVDRLRSNATACLGLPVDRVLGLVEGTAAEASGPDPVSERRPMDGRVANVLDPVRLVALASEVIERSLGMNE